MRSASSWFTRNHKGYINWRFNLAREKSWRCEITSCDDDPLITGDWATSPQEARANLDSKLVKFAKAIKACRSNLELDTILNINGFKIKNHGILNEKWLIHKKNNWAILNCNHTKIRRMAKAILNHK